MSEPEHRPVPPEYDVPADEDLDYGDVPAQPGTPLRYHDAESMLPPPVSGSID